MILAADGRRQWVGVLHAGREGFDSGSRWKGVLSMSKQGMAPESLTAAIGASHRSLLLRG